MRHNNAIMSFRDSVQDELEQIGAGVVRVVRGAAAGFIGGAIAAYLMNRYQEIESRPVTVRREEQDRRDRGEETPAPAVQEQAADGDPKVQVAQHVSRKLFDHELSDVEKKAASPAVHYGYGAAVGALYGGLAEVVPMVGLGLGIPYATLLWAGGDEIALPALGLTESPTQIPPQKHASALAMHFVYGVSLDISRRILRRLL
jgi:putative membrane protein